MKIIYLIRHGKASLDGTDRNRGLTEEGIEHANQISKILINTKPKIQKIYSSPLNRAILTIEPLAKSLELEIKIIEDLKEKITGETSGQNLNDLKQKMWSDFDTKLPEGESSNEASTRAISALNSIVDQLEDGQTAAVQCHGTLIGLIMHHFDNSFGFEEWKNMTMPDIYKITYENNNASVEHIGCDSIETFKIGN